MEEHFGSCTNHGECEAACPKSISIDFIALMNKDYLKAKVANRRTSAAPEAGRAVPAMPRGALSFAGNRNLTCVACDGTIAPARSYHALAYVHLASTSRSEWSRP